MRDSFFTRKIPNLREVYNSRSNSQCENEKFALFVLLLRKCRLGLFLFAENKTSARQVFEITSRLPAFCSHQIALENGAAEPTVQVRA
jgi:hypothetical protein